MKKLSALEVSELEAWETKFFTYISAIPNEDSSHGVYHCQRVWRAAKDIALNELSDEEDFDFLVLLAASYFHDLVNLPKNHPDRNKASSKSAEAAATILRKMNFPENKIKHTMSCIASHSFSANIMCKSLEAEVLQDADRLEALGAIGLARTFNISGQLGTQLFHDTDPLAKHRDLDDKTYCFDHFFTKLLQLPDSFKTNTGKQEANHRAQFLLDFKDQLLRELYQ